MADASVAEIHLDRDSVLDPSELSSWVEDSIQVRAIEQPSRLVGPLLVLLASVTVLAVATWPFLLAGALVSCSEPRAATPSLVGGQSDRQGVRVEQAG